MSLQGDNQHIHTSDSLPVRVERAPVRISLSPRCRRVRPGVRCFLRRCAVSFLTATSEPSTCRRLTGVVHRRSAATSESITLRVVRLGVSCCLRERHWQETGDRRRRRRQRRMNRASPWALVTTDAGIRLPGTTDVVHHLRCFPTNFESGNCDLEGGWRMIREGE